jgi:hypothetical protein
MGLDLIFYKVDSSSNRTNLEDFGITFLRDNIHLFVDLLIEYAYNYTSSINGNTVIDVYDSYCHNSVFDIIIYDIEYQVISEFNRDIKYKLSDEQVKKLKDLIEENKLSEVKIFYQNEIKKKKDIYSGFEHKILKLIKIDK